MSVLYVRARDHVTPATFTVDFNDVVDTPGPYMVGITAWVSTASALAGVFDMGVSYVDPTVSTRDVVFGAAVPRLFLNDSASFFATDMVVIQRQSGSSLWQLSASVVSGIASTSLISYRIIHSSAASGDLQAW
jgi:hypothetical protein